ncbi:MAG: YafY family transcriptional regulator [Kangiellaceae bacterium]|nr:YafY family transcriptional regulator [Kangiellaceae bacterium]
MRKADRLFQLVNIVRNRQPITAEDIAVELNVSVRSIYRYIEDLSVSGIPIYGVSGLGYKLDKQFELPPINLNKNELEALLLGVDMIRSWTGNDLSNSAKSLYAKIAAAIPDNIKNDFSATIFSPSFDDRHQERHHWELLRTAIKHQNIVDIKYQSLDNTESRRKIYPLGLLYWGSKWTIASWCTLRSDFRSFRIDLLTELETLNDKFETNSQICLKKFLSTLKHNY